MQTLLNTLIVIITYAVPLLAQAPDTLWTKTFGGTDSDMGYSVIQTSDGGYVVTGTQYSFSAGNADVGFLKTDSDGNLLWIYNFGGPEYDRGYSVKETSDGGFIIAGMTESFGAGGLDVWLIKTNANGIHQWSKTFGGTGDDYGMSVIQTSDGGYIIAGYTLSSGAGGYDVWLIKTNANGIHQWSKTFGGTGNDLGMSVIQTSDGGYAVAGYQNSFSAGNFDVGFLKTDASGNLLWIYNFGGPEDDRGFSVKETSDGGFIIVGMTESFGAGLMDVWLIKTNANGIHQWSKTFGGTGNDLGMSVIQTSDGGYAVAGYQNSFGAGDYDVGFLKTDSDGNLLWITSFGGSGYDYGNSVQQTSDGGYIIAGYTETSGAGGFDVWLIKVEPDVTGVEEESFLSRYSLFQNYPNPFNSTSVIKYSIPKSSQVSLKIFNALGQELETLVNEEKPIGTYELTWDASNLPSGVYFYRLQAGDFVQTRKMILLK